MYTLMFEWYNAVLLLNTIGFECCNLFSDFQPVAQNTPDRPNHYGQNPLRQFSTTTHLSDLSVDVQTAAITLQQTIPSGTVSTFLPLFSIFNCTCFEPQASERTRPKPLNSSPFLNFTSLSDYPQATNSTNISGFPRIRRTLGVSQSRSLNSSSMSSLSSTTSTKIRSSFLKIIHWHNFHLLSFHIMESAHHNVRFSHLVLQNYSSPLF